MKKEAKPFKIHPQAQVIITGKPLSVDQVDSINKIVGSKFCVANWLGPDGTVGHIDAIRPGTTFEMFQADWLKLIDCLFLDLGITVMNGPPGSPVIPVVSYALKHGTMSRQPDVHFSHPPPRRLKQPRV